MFHLSSASELLFKRAFQAGGEAEMAGWHPPRRLGLGVYSIMINEKSEPPMSQVQDVRRSSNIRSLFSTDHSRLKILVLSDALILYDPDTDRRRRRAFLGQIDIPGCLRTPLINRKGHNCVSSV